MYQIEQIFYLAHCPGNFQFESHVKFSCELVFLGFLGQFLSGKILPPFVRLVSLQDTGKEICGCC